MFYLVGVLHDVQSIGADGAETPSHVKFRECLEKTISAHKPVAIAEEYNLESIETATFRKKSPQEAFTPKIAARTGIRHVFCEPDIRTKVTFGYQGELEWLRHIDGLWNRVSEPERSLLGGALHIAKDFPPREKYWLDTLRKEALLEKNVIFVCGDGHIETFPALLGKESIPSEVVERQIGMPQELIMENTAKMTYLRDNRNRVEEYFKKILDDNEGSIPHLPLPKQRTQP